MFKKILTTVFGLSIGAGFLLVLGTAGSSDLNLIDFKTILIQSGIGLVLVWIGFKGLKITNPVYFD